MAATNSTKEAPIRRFIAHNDGLGSVMFQINAHGVLCYYHEHQARVTELTAERDKATAEVARLSAINEELVKKHNTHVLLVSRAADDNAKLRIKIMDLERAIETGDASATIFRLRSEIATLNARVEALNLKNKHLIEDTKTGNALLALDAIDQYQRELADLREKVNTWWTRQKSIEAV